MSGSGGYQKRKKHNYISSNKRKRNSLKPGVKGFLCTCNNREKECVSEAYNILNEYADRLISKEKVVLPEDPQNEAEKNPSSDEDVDTALGKELDQLKAEAREPKWRRFQVVDSGATNCVFIQTSLSDPVTLVSNILKDIENTKEQKTRFLLRMLPIEVTCKAFMDDIKQEIAPLLDKHFRDEAKTFCIAFTRRCNSSIDRGDIIREVGEMVAGRNPLNRADLNNAELTILVEVMRNICCLSVIPDYFKYKKYNLVELCAPEKVDGSGDAKPKEDDECAEDAEKTIDDKKEECDENGGEHVKDPLKEESDDGGSAKSDLIRETTVEKEQLKDGSVSVNGEPDSKEVNGN